MANKQWDNYREYKKKNENLTPITNTGYDSEAEALLKEAKEKGQEIICQNKVYTSGHTIATYILSDGRVAEFHQFHMLKRAWIWANKEDYDNYKEATPFGIWCG